LVFHVVGNLKSKGKKLTKEEVKRGSGIDLRWRSSIPLIMRSNAYCLFIRHIEGIFRTVFRKEPELLARQLKKMRYAIFRPLTPDGIVLSQKIPYVCETLR